MVLEPRHISFEGDNVVQASGVPGRVVEMNLLASDLVSSDSDDADYVPPPQPSRAEPRIRNRRTPGGIAPPSDDDDDDDDDFDQLSEDAFLADRQALAPASSSGAPVSSSGAGASSSRAALSSSAATPAAPHTAGSSASHGMPSTSTAGSSASHAALAAATAPPLGPGPSNVGQSASALQKPSTQSARTAGIIPKRPRESQPHSQPNSTAEPSSSTGPPTLKVQQEQTSNAQSESQPSEQIVAKKADPVVANDTGDTVQKAKIDGSVEPPAMKRARLSPQKESIDDIWAEMNSKTPPKPQKNASADNHVISSWFQKPVPKSSKPFKVRMLQDLETEQTKQNPTETPPETQIPGTGLEAVLDLVRGKKQTTVLDGTRKQWSQFKKDEDVKEELESYKKGKERYTGRMAFLARSDVREWEFEQSGKRKRR
ncbi:unnamed protein product [Agarophyton chilense]